MGLKTGFLIRKKDAHKGDFGHVFIIAGSRGMTGAAVLAAQACLVCGAGLVTVGIPESLNNIIECKLTEVMSLPLAETGNGTLSPKAFPRIQEFSERADIIVVGPGLSTDPQTQKLIINIIRRIKKPLVIDADAINALANDHQVLAETCSQTVITPHPGEMSRLLGVKKDYLQKNRRKLAKRLASMYNIVTILKGHQTVVADAKHPVYINDTGNPGMAKAGSGDVLTGIVAAFMAQKGDVLDSAKLAVYVHGKAADLAVKDKALISLTATDMIKYLPVVLKKMKL